MGAEAREAEGAALAVLDREHDPRAEASVGASPWGATGESGFHKLFGRVAELEEVFDQLGMANRRIADFERFDHLLVEVLLGERPAGSPAALRFPEIGLEELAGIREHRLYVGSILPAGVRVLGCRDGGILPGGPGCDLSSLIDALHAPPR